jgi:hypothetical protein
VRLAILSLGTAIPDTVSTQAEALCVAPEFRPGLVAEAALLV